MLNEIYKMWKEFQIVYGKNKDCFSDQLEKFIMELEIQLVVKEKGGWMIEVVEVVDFIFMWIMNILEVILDGGFDIVIGNLLYEGQEGVEYKGEFGDFYLEKEGFRYYFKIDFF